VPTVSEVVLPHSFPQFVAMIAIWERSPGHFELRAYSAAPGQQVTRTYSHPRKEKSIGIAEAKKRLARLVSDVADGKLCRHWTPRRS
jgi:hypothetical protein